jgi:hypothetical protein
MKKFLFSLLTSFFSLSVTAVNPYQDYLAKVFDTKLEVKRDFTTLKTSSELNNWLNKVDNLLDSDKLTTYKADLSFSLDNLGNIEELNVSAIYEDDLEKFKSFISDLSAISFPKTSIDLTNFIFKLEGETLYLDRPQQKIQVLKAKVSKDLNLKLSKDLDEDFVLHKPKFLDFPFIGQEIILKNSQDLYLKTYVSSKKGSKLELSAYQAYDEDEQIRLDEKIELKKLDDKNFLATLISSGLANGLKAGLINSYQTYGIAPGALALMGMTGTAIIEAETDDSFAFSQGESIKIKKVEEK